MPHDFPVDAEFLLREVRAAPRVAAPRGDARPRRVDAARLAALDQQVAKLGPGEGGRVFTFACPPIDRVAEYMAYASIGALVKKCNVEALARWVARLTAGGSPRGVARVEAAILGQPDPFPPEPLIPG